MGMDSACVVLLVLNSFTFGQKPLIPCDDILEENERLRAENAWLKDVIRDNITQLTQMIQANSQDIQDNADNLGIVEMHVAANDGNIVSTNRRIDENKAYIDDNKANIIELTDDINENTENINKQTIRIDENTANIVDITNNINTLNLAPVGTILAWTPRPNKDSNESKDLPDGWQECDGAEIVDGIWKGQKTPNINGEGRFLRGAGDKIKVLHTEEDQVRLYYDHRADANIQYIVRSRNCVLQITHFS